MLEPVTSSRPNPRPSRASTWLSTLGGLALSGLVVGAILSAVAGGAAAGEPSLTPFPARMKVKDGTFSLNAKTKIVVPSSLTAATVLFSLG